MMDNASNNLLAISGSLREQSLNSVLLRAIIGMAPSRINATLYNELAQLPHFNPDLDTDDVPLVVRRWRTSLRNSSGVLLCTPEYAKGVPGSLKNALDWVVSSGEFVDKPVAVVSASPHPSGGASAHASLVGTLAMMNARIVDSGHLQIPFIGLKLDHEGNITDEDTQENALNLLNTLVRAMA